MTLGLVLILIMYLCIRFNVLAISPMCDTAKVTGKTDTIRIMTGLIKALCMYNICQEVESTVFDIVFRLNKGFRYTKLYLVILQFIQSGKE